MNKRDLLLEIGLEEMPARVITDSVNQLSAKVQAWLEERKINFDTVKTFSTPRRLALFITNLDEAQPDIHEEAKGPAKKIAVNDQGEWTKAAEGFSRGQGKSVDDLYFKEINGVEYAHVKKFTKGRKTAELLPELKQVITSLTFPKNMRWANEDLKYVRPIKWIVVLFGNEVIPMTIAGAVSGNKTFGHRFLGREISLSSPAEYAEAILSQFVVADATERKRAIVSQINRIAEEKQWTIPIEEDLLEEVNNLVEYPTALFGHFEQAFLELPEEVLITSMKEHQRYFPVKSPSGDLLPYFVTVRNGDHLHLEQVAKGNEKVLRARLADAAFFFREDQKLVIETALQKLDSIVYHEEIGTLASKVDRVRELTNRLANMLELTERDRKAADRAAQICKFDLVTQMVYEFPELQGTMGEKYALQQGEQPEVAAAINEHYMPRNAEDRTPAANVSAVLAIADKLDTIVSFFSIGKLPTGSQDPYALRRQATGIIQTLIDKDWRISFEQFLYEALQLNMKANHSDEGREGLFSELVQFFKLRIKHLLQERGIRYDLIEAVLGGEIGAPASLVRKAQILDRKKDAPYFKESIEAFSRVLNIASKANADGDVQRELFENEYEKTLFQSYLTASQQIDFNEGEEEAFEMLVSLRDPINDYFDHTMVMADDPTIRANRLALMGKLARLINNFAKMNEIIVK
ncbi:glycine--tRNA ligase subunit beta [Bacillus canaveralius]|uniref:Glycine--tRNA ligase beta subunit n=1 Tax=Bacillus canaveralius TaxID=1403243 RepID=A0A2N5GRU0_9BACI|nr:glycine--tRNA ligase subunit beta [Bacillus canaveralius]PLR86151.1 glycine--tRNA ligase subunit beta [Bacillus canaveralius]PLS00272.1 glycine--tRNA ligase subunit beta [Bacillus canaveralius]RSK56233.1 glycine--tRNA ligase subunit beta [Bacillus canaveralius]